MQHNKSVDQESGQGALLGAQFFLIISLENFLSMTFLPTFSINTISNPDIYMAHCLYIKKTVSPNYNGVHPNTHPTGR